MIADDKLINEESIKAGEGNDGTDVKSLLNPESRRRRRRDAPLNTPVNENPENEETPQFPDAQSVSQSSVELLIVSPISDMVYSNF